MTLSIIFCETVVKIEEVAPPGTDSDSVSESESESDSDSDSVSVSESESESDSDSDSDSDFEAQMRHHVLTEVLFELLNSFAQITDLLDHISGAQQYPVNFNDSLVKTEH